MFWDWLISFVVAVLGALGALFLLWRNRRALEELIRSMRNLEGGRPVRRLLGRYPGKTGELVNVMNEIAPALEARLGRLEADRKLLETVLEGMNEGVLAVDGRRRVTFVNQSAMLLFGLEESGTGKLLAELVRSPEVQKAVEATLRSTQAHKEEIQLPVRRSSRARGGMLTVSVHGSRLGAEADAGAILVFHDVTDLRRLERMRQDFVANASHELKTPLAAIKALTETLIDGAIYDEEVNLDFLHRIEEQSDRLNSLILDMLSLARLDSAHEFFRHVPIAVGPALRQCHDTHQSRALTKGLRLILHLGNVNDDVMVVADPEAMRQVLDNLVDNALKYTGEGGRVSVSARASVDRVILEVADTGIGIPRDELPRVFERFYRVDKARSRAVAGTGLGLSIVKHLVQTLGGKISVESRVNAGSVFRVDLPRYQSATQEAVTAARGPGTPEHVG